MPPRSTPPPPKGAFYPPNDMATWRDLLLFEERLKSNAAQLQWRKSRYQLFLTQLLLVIFFLLLEVFAHWSLLRVIYRFILTRILPDSQWSLEIPLHPYIPYGLLFLSIATLVLFFASGMYSEKIAYANQYVPHANRALRSFNMYLNVRKPPLRSRYNPLAFFFPRDSNTNKPAASPPMSPTHPPARKSLQSTPSTPIAISPIPPSLNPRGELIFSSRVDRTFREAYERYRAAFERKRGERMSKNVSMWRKWLGRWVPWPWTSEMASPSPSIGSSGGGTSSPSRLSPSATTKPRVASGASSRSGTPPTVDGERVHRRGSPSGSVGRRSGSRTRSGGSRTPSASSATKARGQHGHGHMHGLELSADNP